MSAEYLVERAIQEIFSKYGDRVSVLAKSKSLLKFGKNVGIDSGVTETVWTQGGDETFVTTNAIDKISSSSASDTEEIYIEGHTVTGTGTDAQFTFASQTVTLAGQTETALTTPLARVSRAYVTSSSSLVGDVYIYEDDTVTAGVPQTASKIHMKILGTAGDTQSFKAATTFSNEDYFICTGGYAACVGSSTANVNLTLEVRTVGSVFRPTAGRVALSGAGQPTAQVDFTPYVIIPKNADVRIRALSDANNTVVDASFQGFLAKVVS